MRARVIAFPAHRLRRRPSARVLAPALNLEARRRAELAVFAALGVVACLASLAALLLRG